MLGVSFLVFVVRGAIVRASQPRRTAAPLEEENLLERLPVPGPPSLQAFRLLALGSGSSLFPLGLEHLVEVLQRLEVQGVLLIRLYLLEGSLVDCLEEEDLAGGVPDEVRRCLIQGLSLAADLILGLGSPLRARLARVLLRLPCLVVLLLLRVQDAHEIEDLVVQGDREVQIEHVLHLDPRLLRPRRDEVVLGEADEGLLHERLEEVQALVEVVDLHGDLEVDLLNATIGHLLELAALREPDVFELGSNQRCELAGEVAIANCIGQAQYAGLTNFFDEGSVEDAQTDCEEGVLHAGPRFLLSGLLL